MKEKDIQPLKVDRTKLITKTAYAKLKKVSAPHITQECRRGNLNTIKIIGGELILLD